MAHAKGERKYKPTAGLGTRPCMTCGVEFQPYRSTNTHCSRSCHNRSKKARQTLSGYRERPEVRERIRYLRRVDTAPDPERVRRYNLRSALSKYGVTIAWYEGKLAEQDGKCLLCGHVPPPDAVRAASRLHVDHDHNTGVVRDLLCTRCNMGIGYFTDDPELMRRAAEYVERHRAR